MNRATIKNDVFKSWFKEFGEKSGKNKFYGHFDYNTWKGIKRATDWATEWIIEDYNTEVTITATDKENAAAWCFDTSDKSFGSFIDEKYDNWLWTAATRETQQYSYIDECGKMRIAIENNNIKEDKEKEKMSMFNFDFGPVKNSPRIRMSPFGLAIMAADGVWKSYNAKDKKIVDVDVFTFDASKFLYKMPVAIKDVKVGDIVIHNGEAVIVSVIEENATSIAVVDVRHGESKNILPTYSPFGFDFITKVVSFLDMTGAASADSPFGNMLPFLMMNENEDIDPMMFLFMGQNGGNAFDFKSNPMMLYFLTKSGSGKDNMLPLMFLMNGGKQ